MSAKDSIGFAPELVPLIKNGIKTFTYRIGDKYNFLKAGDRIKIRDSSNDTIFAEVEIIKKTFLPFKDLPIDRKGHEVYKSKQHQRQIFKKYYKKIISDEEKMLILEFKVVNQYN